MTFYENTSIIHRKTVDFASFAFNVAGCTDSCVINGTYGRRKEEYR